MFGRLALVDAPHVCCRGELNFKHGHLESVTASDANYTLFAWVSKPGMRIIYYLRGFQRLGCELYVICMGS